MIVIVNFNVLIINHFCANKKKTQYHLLSKNYYKMENSTSSQLVNSNSIESTNSSVIDSRILIPYFSLYSDRIVVHPRPFVNITKKKQNHNSLANLKKTKFTGNLSKTQQSIIKKKLTAWLTSIQLHNESQPNKFIKSEYYPVFITLTLSSKQIHSDKDIKRRLLDMMIKRLKKEFGVNKYFWRAETQENGNIHFHLIVDKYCSWIKLRDMWNQIQNVLGYIDRFENVHMTRNPNSVDVKGVKDVGNFVNYVLKYCLKDEKNRKIEGRLFGMSDELRNIGVFQDVIDSEMSTYMERYVKYNYFTVYRSDFFTVLFFKKEFYQSSFYNELMHLSKSYYLKLYNNLYISAGNKSKILKSFKIPLINRASQLSLFQLSDQIKIINHYNYINTKISHK